MEWLHTNFKCIAKSGAHQQTPYHNKRVHRRRVEMAPNVPLANVYANIPNGPAVDEKDLTLVHVFVLFRHGDRSPITPKIGPKLTMTQAEREFWIARLADVHLLNALNSGTRVVNYDNDHMHKRMNGRSDNDKDVEEPLPAHHGGRWPCGQLTTKGVYGMQAKGRALRERYSNFLTGLDPIRDVHVQCTNVRRTIRSAQSVLSGMFPAFFPGFDSSKQQQNQLSHYDDKERELFTVYADDSGSIAPTHSYAIYSDLSLLLADDFKNHAPPRLAKVTKHIRKLLDIPPGERVAWTGLREVLVCRKEHGLPIPDGLDGELFEQIRALDGWLWYTLYGKRDFCYSSFRSGVERIYKHLTAIQEKTNPYKFSLFSGHDNSIVALASALQLQIQHTIPNYGAMLTFEIYENPRTGELYIKVLYEGEQIAFAGQEYPSFCKFAHFQHLAQDFLRHQVQGTKL